tara:strand:+ start:1310 stop:3712 length:2403 start_codon:yes stop_codon:yes gene_type:complete
MMVLVFYFQIGDLVKKEILIVLCLFFSIFSSIMPSTFAESDTENDLIELSFDLFDLDSGEIIDSAEIFVIEGWSGTILEQKTFFSGDSIDVIKNHSLRFKFSKEGYNDWNSISNIYYEEEIINVNFTTNNETYNFTIEEEANVTGGNVGLFFNSMSSNSNINLSWEANYEFSMHLGTNLLPTKSLGLSGQIDYWIGNKDGILQFEEEEMFTGWFQQQAWTDPYFGGCCKIDGNFPLVSDLVSPEDTWLNLELGIWGWNESTTLSVHSGFTGNRLLEIPLQNDIRQLANMQIITHPDWEYRYSPNSEWIYGSPTNININRSISGIGGFIPITFAKNTAPIAQSTIIGYMGSSLPLGVNITFDGSSSTDSSHNIGLGSNLECVWTFKSGDLTFDFPQMITIVNLTNLGFLSNTTLETILECTDPQGLTDLWNKSWYLDSTSPNAIELYGDAECIDKPSETNLLECNELLVESSKMLLFNLTLEDDGPANPIVFWSSNHIDGWSAEGNEMNVAFWQGQNTNINFVMYDQHHQERELSIWNLSLRVSDEVANDWIKSWNVTVLDGSAPRIKMKLLNQEQLLDPMNIYFGDEIFVNLNSSFDDINSIEDVKFIIKLNGEIIANSNEIGWDEIKLFLLPELEVGVHELIINATDKSDNYVEERHEIYIQPALSINISTEVNVPLGELIEGENDIEFKLINTEGSSYDVIICIQSDCLDYNGTGATIDGFGYTNFTLTFNLNKSESLDVNYTFKFNSEMIQFNETYNFEFKDNKENNILVTLFVILIACVCIVIGTKFVIDKKRIRF